MSLDMPLMFSYLWTCEEPCHCGTSLWRPAALQDGFSSRYLDREVEYQMLKL